ISDQRILLRTERIDHETKPIAAIVISVEQDRDRIIIGEICIAHEFTRIDMFGVRVESTDTEIDILIIEEQANLCSFRSRCAFVWLLLEKISGRLGQRPSGFIKHSVNL